MADTDPPPPYEPVDNVITFAGKEYRASSLTVAETVELEDLLGVPYSQISYGRIKHRVALLAMFLRRDHTEDETAALIGPLLLTDLEEMHTQVPLDTPTSYQDGLPLPGGASPTSGSSSAPNGTGGRRTSRAGSRSAT